MAEAGGLQDITNIDTTPTPMPAGQPGRQSVGEMLRAAREAAWLDIKQLSQATRVTTRHLQALEVGDYAAFPGRPYTLGFAKSYARAVGLDDKVVAEAVRAELDQQAPPPPPRVINQFEVGDPEKTPSRLTAWLAAGLVIAIALAAFVNSTVVPLLSIGVITMKMISSTNITSTIGVTLISATIAAVFSRFISLDLSKGALLRGLQWRGAPQDFNSLLSTRTTCGHPGCA